MAAQLNGEKIALTVKRLRARIDERFPSSGLTEVCVDLSMIADRAIERSRFLRRPYWSLRILITLLLASLAALAVWGGSQLRISVSPEITRATQFIQILEPALGSVVFVGAAILFLWTLETRLKRSRALEALHELRSLAHVIDMHQLTKDPEIVLHGGPTTASSPKRDMTPFELSRYLDYSSEMLALLAKVAALYVQGFADPVVLGGVDQIETLTTGLCGKISQKMSVIELGAQLPDKSIVESTTPSDA